MNWGMFGAKRDKRKWGSRYSGRSVKPSGAWIPLTTGKKNPWVAGPMLSNGCVTRGHKNSPGPPVTQYEMVPGVNSRQRLISLLFLPAASNPICTSMKKQKRCDKEIQMGVSPKASSNTWSERQNLKCLQVEREQDNDGKLQGHNVARVWQ